MMRTLPIVAFVLFASVTSVLALEIPRSASQDSRVRFVNYQPFNITRVVGTLRSSVQVEFASDEEIVHVALGNSVAWEVAPAGNILFLKPRENQPVTNISVVTTRRDGSTRSYQMELTVRDGSVEAGQNTYFYVKFRYPEDEAAFRRQQAASRALAAGEGSRQCTGPPRGVWPPKLAIFGARVSGTGAAKRLRQWKDHDVCLHRQPGNACDLYGKFGRVGKPSSEVGRWQSRHGACDQPQVHPTAGQGRALRVQRAYDRVGINPDTNTTSPR